MRLDLIPANWPDVGEMGKEIFQFRNGKETGRAAAEGSLGDSLRIDCGGDNLRLSLDAAERLIDESSARLNGGEQVAEAAAHFAEGQMDIEKQIPFVLELPGLLNGHRWIEWAIGGLVRIGV